MEGETRAGNPPDRKTLKAEIFRHFMLTAIVLPKSVEQKIAQRYPNCFQIWQVELRDLLSC